MSDRPKRKPPQPKRGRPVKYGMPDPIPDTPENIARALLGTRPKKRGEWKHIKKRRRWQG